MMVFSQDHAVVAAAQYQNQDLGYYQIPMTAAAVGLLAWFTANSLTFPTDARWARISATVADTVRWRADGTAPASGVGNPIPVVVDPAVTCPPLVYSADFTNLSFYGAATSKVNIDFYR